MKIAIYHNLERGGALVQLEEIVRVLKKQKNSVDLFSLNNNADIRLFDQKFITKLDQVNNIFKHLIQVLIKIPKVNKQFSVDICAGKYDLVLIFPCQLTQSPPILKYLRDHKNVIYIFAETKREFYEKVSFDHYSIKRWLARILRYPIKFIDIYNCQSAKKIVSNSYYSANILKKIYSKQSTTIYPGIVKVPIYKLTKKNNKKIISLGLISKLKGYDFSIKQLEGVVDEYTIVGRTTLDSKYIFDLAKNSNIKLNLIEDPKNSTKNLLLKLHSIFLANQEHEPFGLTTLEASNEGLVVLGINQGGTSEIIEIGVNGYLYPRDLELSKRVLTKIYNKDKIDLYKTFKIDWQKYVSRLIKLYE